MQRLQHLRRARAISIPAAHRAHRRQQQPHQPRQQNRAALHPSLPARRRNHPAHALKQQAAKQAPHHPAHQRHRQHPQPQMLHLRAISIKITKIRVVAHNRHLREARRQNADKNLPLPAQHHIAPQLFNRKNHPRQWRIKRRRQAACRASCQQIVVLQACKRQIALFAPAPPARHHRRPHLHRRPFAPNRSPAQHPQKRERHFIQRLAKAHRPLFGAPIRQRNGSNHLRNPAAHRVRRKPPHQPSNQHQAKRQHQPSKPRIRLHPMPILLQGKFRHLRKNHRHPRHQQRTNQQIQQRHRLARQPPHLPPFSTRPKTATPHKIYPRHDDPV